MESREVIEAVRLDEVKARGHLGPLYVAVAKLAEEVGSLLKLLSVAHRTSESISSYFDSELGDVVFQVYLLCERRGLDPRRLLEEGRERFRERLELKEKW